MNKEQKRLDKWFKKNNWSYWPPMSILARLMEETGEFARLVNRIYGDKKKRTDESKQEFEDEIGDILYTLTCFANSHKINLDKALRKSINKVAKRDKGRFKSNPK
jgi:NTP pyrophosphatase (non-canonical NTP hydrolase)